MRYLKTVDGEYVKEEYATRFYVRYDDGDWYVMCEFDDGERYHLSAHRTEDEAREAMDALIADLNGEEWI